MIYHSIQLDQNNIVQSIGQRPSIIDVFYCGSVPIQGVSLGMKYDAETNSFYQLDEYGDLIIETAIDVSQYVG